MENGWIKLHRKLLENPIHNKPAWLALWVILLLLANHDENNSFIWNGKRIKQEKGQFITGRKKLAELSGIPETTIERILNYLETEHQIGQQKTSKYRLITILKWELYQKMDTKSDNKWTTNGQQTDTIKNLKNVRNKEEDIAEQAPQDEIVSVIYSFKEVNPSYGKWFGNTTQRAACQRLLKIHGKEKLLQVIAILPKSNQMEYVPTITTPVQLEDKWAGLESALIKKKAEITKKTNQVAF